MSVPGGLGVPLGALRVHVSGFMVGSRFAVKKGLDVTVSPAMWSLMKGATHEELAHLFRHLQVIDLDGPERVSREAALEMVRALAGAVQLVEAGVGVADGGKVMSVPDTRYTLVKESRGFCRECGKPVAMLIPVGGPDAGPGFGICWDCRSVVQYGVGKVEESGADCG